VDDFDIDDVMDELFGENEPEASPNYRATYRKKQLTVVPFFPSMIVTGPSSGWFRNREKAGAVIADLTKHSGADGDEVALSYRAAGRHREAAR
jgi:hypothetical protein